MAVASAQDIQEQIRQQQLMGMPSSSQQQPFHPMAAGGNYAPYVPQAPLQIPNMQNNERARGTPVNMGKLSLLTISFSLMLLGAFTFLGGFLLGIWVAGPNVSQPTSAYSIPQQNPPYYPTTSAYPQGVGAQQGSNFEQNLGRKIGAATESAIKGVDIHGMPTVVAPIFKAAQSEVGRQVGATTEDYLKQQLGSGAAPTPSYPPQQSYPQQQPNPQQQFSPPPMEPYSHHPTGGRAQLPVITPQSGAAPIPSAQANEESYTVQLGAFASPENANALANHVQALSYLAQITEGKAPDGSQVYYVHSGSYKDYTTALNAVSQFAAQNIPGAVIVKTSPQHKSAQ